MSSPLNNIDRAIEKIRNGVNDLIKQGFVPIVNQEISTEILTPEGDFVFISQAMSRKPEVSKQMWELEKLAQTPCYNHTQCGEDCLPDCPHYAERKPEKKSKQAFKYGLEISEPQKRLWVGEVINGIVHRCLYSDTWNGIRMIGTREKTIENAKLIVKALNAFDGSVDAPYCHDLEQRIELLEMQLEETQVNAAAYDRLMSGGKKTLNELANILGKPVAIDAENRLLWFPKKPEIGVATWIWYDNQFGCFGEELPDGLINFTGYWKDSLTLPDGWEEK